jgi:hypothetical protein
MVLKEVVAKKTFQNRLFLGIRFKCDVFRLNYFGSHIEIGIEFVINFLFYEKISSPYIIPMGSFGTPQRLHLKDCKLKIF